MKNNNNKSNKVCENATQITMLELPNLMLKIAKFFVYQLGIR